MADRLVPTIGAALALTLAATSFASMTDTTVVATRGVLFVHGNRLDPPYRLALRNKVLMTNDLVLRTTSPQPAPPSPDSAYWAARLAAMKSIFAAASGVWADSRREAVEAALNAARSNPLVASAKPSDTDHAIEITWRRGGPSEYCDLTPSTGPVDTSPFYYHVLLRIRAVLDEGGIVLIGAGYTTYVPASRSAETLAYIKAMPDSGAMTRRQASPLSPSAERDLSRPRELMRADSD